MSVKSWEKWLRRDYWSRYEACCLMTGLDPEESGKAGTHHYNLYHGFQNYDSGHRGAPDAKYLEIFDTSTRSERVGKLQPAISTFGLGHESEVSFEPKAFVTWAHQKNFSVPTELESFLSFDHEGNQKGQVECEISKPKAQAGQEVLNPKAESSLLQIIKVLAIKAGVDLNKHYSAATIIDKMAFDESLAIPQREALAGWLKKAHQIEPLSGG